MRHFVYFSRQAQTSGNFSDLMKAGRMDIAIHVIIASLFLSYDIREDTKIHLVFYGMPDPPKHIEIQPNPELDISKKDVATLIKKDSSYISEPKPQQTLQYPKSNQHFKLKLR